MTNTPEYPEICESISSEFNALLSTYDQTKSKLIEYIHGAYINHLHNKVYADLKQNILDHLSFLLDQKNIQNVQKIEQQEFIEILQNIGIDIQQNEKYDFETHLLEELAIYNLNLHKLQEQFISENSDSHMLENSVSDNTYSIQTEGKNILLYNNNENNSVFNIKISELFTDEFLGYIQEELHIITSEIIDMIYHNPTPNKVQKIITKNS